MQKLVPRFLLLFALLISVLVFRPGLHGPFLFDDGANIVGNEHLRLQDFSKESLLEAAFSVPNGISGRPLSMLSFALNYYIDRDKIEPFPTAHSFKLTNLAIHLLNGLAVFILTRMLVGLYRERRQPGLPAAYPEWLALAVAAAWLLHPLNLTSVLYVVQRMASLAALFTFVGLALYFWGRGRLCRGQRHGILAIFASLLVFGPLAWMSKENGLLLPFFMLAAEVVLFRFETAQPMARKFLIGFFVAFAAMPAVLVAGYLLSHPDFIMSSYARRDFTLIERLMTESRVVWFYLRLIVLPSTALMGVYHDDIAISRHLFDPFWTFPAIVGILALPVLGWLLLRRQPLLAFGLAFFLIGHSLESTIYPLELVHEHRNYLPMFGILLAFFHLLLNPLHAVTTKLPRWILAGLLIPLFAVGTLSRASDWASPFSLWSQEVEHHPGSIRAHIELGNLYAGALALDPAVQAQNYQLARQNYEQTLVLDERNTHGLFGLIELSKLHGKPVEKAWLINLGNSLEHEVLPLSTNDNLIGLAMCGAQTTCPVSGAEIGQLIQATLRNPKVTGRAKALIYNAQAIYFFNVTRDYVAAAESIRHAIALDPSDINHQLWLASSLIAMKRPAEARQQIALLRQLDGKGMRKRDIEALESQLIAGR